jgi:site-specific DNA-methyltransferase (adenine-specific)
VRPYYTEPGVAIYHGDAREILPVLTAHAIITDPVWPNASKLLMGCDRPYELFAEMCAAIPPAFVRLVVQLGCNSDPRFLAPVPDRLKFFRACWLSVTPCHFRGRALYSADVAYAFGNPPAGTGIIPGECNSNERSAFPRNAGRNRNPREHEAIEAALPHPAARKLRHVRWLVKHFAGPGDLVVDPFLGSGTTALACKAQGVPFIGIEIEERHCELAASRLSQETIFEDAGALACGHMGRL